MLRHFGDNENPTHQLNHRKQVNEHVRECGFSHLHTSDDCEDGEKEQDGDHPVNEEFLRQDLGIFTIWLTLKIRKAFVTKSSGRAESAASCCCALLFIHTEFSLEGVPVLAIVSANSAVKNKGSIFAG